MTTYLMITHIPAKQGGFFPIPEKYVVERAEASDIETLRIRTHIPLGGKVYVTEIENVTIIEAGLTNRIVDPS